MEFGYARVSRKDQNLDLQMRALLEYGVDEKNIVFEHVSGAKSKRKQLDELLKVLTPGDTLIVWKLDRLVRSLIHFSKLMNYFNDNDIKFKSITEKFIDTTEGSAHSKFLINMFAVLAELERDIIIERTKAGLESAKLRGKVLGRPEGLSAEAEKIAIIAEARFNEGEKTVTEICKELGISRMTYYKYLEYRGLKGKKRPYKKKSTKKGK